MRARDTASGTDGGVQLRRALASSGAAAATDVEVHAGQTGYVREASRIASGPATAVVVWASPAVVAGVVRALREQGSRLPVYTGPTGETPRCGSRWPRAPTGSRVSRSPRC